MPVEITVNLIKKAMKKHGWAGKKFLIDGFPRNQDNQNGWVTVMGDDVDMKFVLFFEASEEVMLDRILKRGEAAGDEKRNDDNVESSKKRFKTFQESTMPIVEMYEAQGKTRRVNAEQDPAAVYEDVLKVFKEII